MKTIIESKSGLSKFIFNDLDEVLFLPERIITPGLVICDMNSSNAELIENITPPADWEGNKYKLIDENWIQNNGLDGMTLEQAKTILMADLVKLREEISFLFLQIRLLYDPEPVALTDMTPDVRALYSFAKTEIEGLTEETYKTYILRGPQVNALFETLNRML